MQVHESGGAHGALPCVLPIRILPYVQQWSWLPPGGRRGAVQTPFRKPPTQGPSRPTWAEQGGEWRSSVSATVGAQQGELPRLLITGQLLPLSSAASASFSVTPVSI